MKKTEINNLIIAEAREKIAIMGLSGKLDIYPIWNTFTRRPRYWSDGTLNYFKVHLWDLNSLSNEDISLELDSRILAARTHFGI